MTFLQLADGLGLSLFDLIPDVEEAEELSDEELFDCYFTDSLIADGILSQDMQEILPELKALNELEDILNTK